MDDTEVDNSKDKSNWGGSRPGAGRPPGSLNKSTAALKLTPKIFVRITMPKPIEKSKVGSWTFDFKRFEQLASQIKKLTLKEHNQLLHMNRPVLGCELCESA